MVLWQRPQHMRATATDGLPEAQASELRIVEHEHVGLYQRQQVVGHRHLGLLAALHAGPNAGMAATLREQEEADLGKGTGSVLIAGALEGGGIGRGIGHILPGAIDGHQPPPKAVGPRGRRRAEGVATRGKEPWKRRAAKYRRAK